MADEDVMTIGGVLPFDESYLDDWELENVVEGERTEILFPTVLYDQGEIFWRASPTAKTF
jgi:hypothetical protein